MAYSVKADIEKVYPAQDLIDLTDDEGTGAQVDVRIAQAITDADALMDTYFRAQHTVPILTPGAAVKNCSVILAYSNLVIRKRALEDNPGLHKTYKDKIRWLEMVAAGKIHISDPDSFQNLGNYIQSNKTSTDKVYTSNKLKQFAS